MGLVTKDDGWRLTDEVGEWIEPLLPVRKPRPLGCPSRNAMNAILFLLRTGCQWNALDATGICSCSSGIYRRSRERTEAGVFEAFWRQGLIKYDDIEGIDWSWLSMDGAMTKAPLSGSKKRCESDGSGQAECQAQPVDRSDRHPRWRLPSMVPIATA